jgi:hypothetical protein
MSGEYSQTIDKDKLSLKIYGSQTKNHSKSISIPRWRQPLFFSFSKYDLHHFSTDLIDQIYILKMQIYYTVG